MGNWNMTVVGVGAHHNTNYPADANKMFAAFVAGLQAAGHSVAHATFTHGGADFVVGDKDFQHSVYSGPADQQVEMLAKHLHEAGRAAVEAGLVVNKVAGQPFLEWDEITEQAREGRRVQARYLLSRFVLIAR